MEWIFSCLIHDVGNFFEFPNNILMGIPVLIYVFLVYNHPIIFVI